MQLAHGTGWAGIARRLPPRLADALLALGIAAITVAGLLLTAPLLPRAGIRLPQEQLLVAVLLAVLQCAPILLWRSRPVVAFVLVELVQLAAFVTAPELQFRGVPSMLVAYGVGARLRPWRAAAVVGVAIVAEVLIGTVVAAAGGADVPASAFGHLLQDGSALLLPMILGITVSARTTTARLLRERAVDQHERQVDDAVAEERRRIAGELHDVAAHHLSGMVVQAAAVERMIDRDPAAARAGAAQLRAQGKATLNGLRSVVGLLRSDGEVAAVSGLRDLPELIASTRTLGVDAVLRRSGEAPELAPIVDAAIYRVAQQALSNAVQHAPAASVEVALTVTPEELNMQVVNGAATRREAGEGRPGGTGLVVMRERAALIGGTLEAGPTAAGGWRVALSLPLVPGTGVVR